MTVDLDINDTIYSYTYFGTFASVHTDQNRFELMDELKIAKGKVCIPDKEREYRDVPVKQKLLERERERE